MAADQKATADSTEATPLLPQNSAQPERWSRSVLYRALLCGFMSSLSFGVTQVPLVYVFRLMTCDAYYETHAEPPRGYDRCENHQIEADTARAVALLGASTAMFGVINLFLTSWTIKKLSIKSALLIQVFNPAVRLAIQSVGVMTGGNAGILIVQCSQIITIVGGPTGYLLALNSYVTEVVENKERTGSLGRLQGCTMFGTSIGFLLGGLVSDAFSIIAPFRLAFVLFLITFSYALLLLPWIPPSKNDVARSYKGLVRFFGPLKLFAPQRWVLQDGRQQLEYGTLLLGIGVFLGVLATGYIPVLLQMYSTDILGFGTTENGYLISLFSLLRGLFLTLLFPRIISAGRSWLSNRSKSKIVRRSTTETSDIQAIPTEPRQLAATEPIENEQEPVNPPRPNNEKETFEFDLFYTKFSLFVDGILTAGASFVGAGWQMYLVATFLPFGSGTGAAAKGTILQMCPASERTDALSAITLVDMIARLSGTSIFGLAFAAFASIGQTYLVFLCNAAVALVGFCVLLFARFPPEGSELFNDVVHERP